MIVFYIVYFLICSFLTIGFRFLFKFLPFKVPNQIIVIPMIVGVLNALFISSGPETEIDLGLPDIKIIMFFTGAIASFIFILLDNYIRSRPSNDTPTIEHSNSKVWWLIPVLAGVFIPGFVELFVKSSLGNMGYFEAVFDVLENLFGGGGIFAIAIGLIPYLLLVHIGKRFKKYRTSGELIFLMICGTIGPVLLTILGHYDYWEPFYTDAHVSSTSSLIFLFIPIYSIFAMLGGVFIGWVLLKFSPKS